MFKIRLDQALKMLTADEPAATKDSPPAASAEAVHQRVAKVERIKEGVHKMAESGLDPSAILTTMQEKVGPLLDAGKVIEAEPELDRALKALGQEPDARPEPAKPAAPKARPDAPSSQLDEATRKRLTEKVERVMEGAKKWAANGRDPSVIGKTMEEKFKPLMEAGKIVEAEAGAGSRARTDREGREVRPSRALLLPYPIFPSHHGCRFRMNNFSSRSSLKRRRTVTAWPTSFMPSCRAGNFA